jgi:hypothetical protein
MLQATDAQGLDAFPALPAIQGPSAGHAISNAHMQALYQEVPESPQSRQPTDTPQLRPQAESASHTCLPMNTTSHITNHVPDHALI